MPDERELVEWFAVTGTRVFVRVVSKLRWSVVDFSMRRGWRLGPVRNGRSWLIWQQQEEGDEG